MLPSLVKNILNNVIKKTIMKIGSEALQKIDNGNLDAMMTIRAIPIRIIYPIIPTFIKIIDNKKIKTIIFILGSSLWSKDVL